MSECKLKPEVKTKWIEALRSGKYQQAQEKLCKINDEGIGYCCLGVLCEISGLEKTICDNGNEYWWKEENGQIYCSDVELPCGFQKSIGMDTHTEEELISMNDGGKSFAEIADYIEKNL